MQFLPLAAAAIPAVLGGIGGILDIIGSAKRLHEGGRIRGKRRLRPRASPAGGHKKKRGGAIHRKKRGGVIHKKKYKHHRVRHMPHKHRMLGAGKRKHKHMRKRRGKGMLADIVGKIPLLGSIAGPLVSMLGGKIRRHRKKPTYKKRGRGLAPMYQYRPYVGHGLAPMYQYKPYLGGMLLPPGGPTMPSRYGGLLSLPGQHLISYNKPFIRGITAPLASEYKSPYGMHPTDYSMTTPLSQYKHLIASLANAPTGSGKRRAHHKRRGGDVIKLPLIGNVASSMIPAWMHSLAIKKRGGLLAPAGGLLHPAGGAAVHRRGHMRKIPGRSAKVHVRATVVHKPHGGYIPYRWGPTR